MDERTARNLLEAEARRLDDTRGGLVDGPAQPADEDLLEREVERSVLHRLEEDRRAVADALARLDAGTYGRCGTCGEPIPAERLEAVPATRFCRTHEEEAEILVEASAVSGDDSPPSAVDRVLHEARQHLDLVPGDELDEDDVRDRELTAEEQAVHIDPSST